MKISISEAELDALNEAIDFISHNTDGAEDYEPFQKLQSRLRNIWRKGIRSKVKTRLKKESK